MKFYSIAGRFAAVRRWMFAGAIVFACSTGSFAVDEPTPGEVLKSALKALGDKDYDNAINLMYTYLSAVDASHTPGVVAIAQDTRYRLASLLIKEKRLEEAAQVLQDYVDSPLAEHPRQAMKMLTTCYFDTEAFRECVTAVTNALYYNENPVVLSSKVVMRKGDDESDEDYSKIEMEPEPEFTQDELNTLHMTLAEAYFKIEMWEECINPYSYVIQHTPDDQRKGYAIMQIINALIEIPAFDRIMDWVPQLYRTDARYDIRVNLALMNAAAALYDEEEYDAALPLYRMIVPKDELVAYQEQKLRDLRVAFGLTPQSGGSLTADEMFLFGGDASMEAAPEEELPKEVQELERLIDALKNLPPYELNIKYRMADLYKVVDRYWEAARFFDLVYNIDPVTEVGQRCIHDLVEMLLDNLDRLKEAEERAHSHMAKFKAGVTPRQLAYMLTAYYQQHDMVPTIKTLKPYVDGFERTNDATIAKYDAELYFMQAVADLVMQQYEIAEKSFKFVLDEFPQSHQEANATYWYAMTQLFLQKYDDALPNFERYIEKFPKETYVDECYFQGGVCMFGQEKYKEAQDRFTYVIDTFSTNSSVYPEACSMRGDIYGSEGMLDEALADYGRAFTAAVKPAQATYATFQSAEIFEAEDRYDEIITVVQRYLDAWGENGADIAKALFWIGKTKIQQKLYDEAVATYVDAIVKYGGDLRQDGVDLMITELVKISQIYLDDEQRKTLRDELETALAEAENETLKLRLRVTVAKLNGTESELGQTLLTELETFDNASPPVLAAICNASFEIEDYSRSEEMLRIFINKFEDSEFMRAAYKLRAFGQYTEKDYVGTLATINDAQALYGTEYNVAWAQLLKAQVLLDEGNIDEAREANLSILTVPSWRGVPVAQATFQLGHVEETAGNLEKAFAFYQRTYFQYKGHAGGYWAAEGYLASARILDKLGRKNDVRNTYRAMLFDRYVNTLPQADKAREILGPSEVAEIENYLATGGSSNITISVEAELKIDSQPSENGGGTTEPQVEAAGEGGE